MPNNVPGESLVHDRRNDIGVNVEETQSDGIFPALDDVGAVHLHAHTQRPSLAEVQDLRVEDRRQPITGQYDPIVESLKVMNECPLWVAGRVVIEQDHGLGTVAIGILFMMIGK